MRSPAKHAVDPAISAPALGAAYRLPRFPLARLMGRAFERWRERRQRRAAIAELQALDDRALRDIGLTRGEIIAAVDGLVHRGGHGHEPEAASYPHPDGEVPSEPSSSGEADAANRGCPDRKCTIDIADLQDLIRRAHRMRAEYVAGLIRRAFGGLARLARRAVRPPQRRKSAQRATRCQLLAVDDRAPITAGPNR